MEDQITHAVFTIIIIDSKQGLINLHPGVEMHNMHDCHFSYRSNISMALEY